MYHHLKKLRLRQLCYFVSAIECGSFRKAGIKIGVQESAISRNIRDLEDYLGASLFHRLSGGVSLTLAGHCFLRRARIALQQIEDGAKDVAAIGRSEEGSIKIGIFSSLASGFLFELLRSFDRGHAGVLVELINGNSSEHVAAVRQLQLDIAFITGIAEWSDCEVEHLWSEQVFAVLPSEHRLTEKERLDWQDLANESFIVSDAAPGLEVHTYLVQRFAALSLHPEIRTQSVGWDILLSMVAMGRRLTLTSEAATGAHIPGIVYRPIANETLPFSAIWSPRNDNPACRRLLSLARSMARSEKASSPPGSPDGSSVEPSQSPDPSR